MSRSEEAPSGHDDVRDAAHAAALADAEKLRQLEATFYAQPGPHLHLVSASGLDVQGFDPMNTYALADGRVLHTRYLRVTDPEVDIEIMGGQALVSGGNLLNITALDIRHIPQPSVTGGLWTVKTDALDIQITAERVQQTAEGWEVHI